MCRKLLAAAGVMAAAAAARGGGGDVTIGRSCFTARLHSWEHHTNGTQHSHFK